MSPSQPENQEGKTLVRTKTATVTLISVVVMETLIAMLMSEEFRELAKPIAPYIPVALGTLQLWVRMLTDTPVVAMFRRK